MGYEFFAIERHGQTATLWLNRGEKLNALNPPFWNELPAVMHELDADPGVRAVVIAGKGKAFTVGLDIKAMSGTLFGEQESRFALIGEIERLQRSISAVAECTKPVIAAVHGWCLGGGIDLITACDVRYAAKDSIFSIRETKIAIVADVGTLQRLPAIIGKGHVAELAYSGEDINAERAAEINLVNRVYADGDTTLAAARDLAERIAENSPLAVQGTKRVLQYCEGKTVEDGLKYVATWNAAFLKSDDLTEAMSAFLEKRKPKFGGK